MSRSEGLGAWSKPFSFVGKVFEHAAAAGWSAALDVSELNVARKMKSAGDTERANPIDCVSGEFNPSLDSVAAQMNMDVLVTSFNGGYIGYITPGKYYDVDHYETRLMNWYAPGTGEYVRNSLKKLMVAVSGSR